MSKWTIRTLKSDWREATVWQRITYVSLIGLELIGGAIAVIFALRWINHKTTSNLIVMLVATLAVVLCALIPVGHGRNGT